MNTQQKIKAAYRVALSRWYLRRATEVGSRPRLWGKPRIQNRGEISIGDRFMAHCGTVRVELVTEPDAFLTIGNKVYMGFGTSIAAYRSITIGDDVKIGALCLISDSDQHGIHPEDRDELPPAADVWIRDHAWLGDRVTVLKGVTIGLGAVVGAGSVVTRDIPAYEVWAGNPARKIRQITSRDRLFKEWQPGANRAAFLAGGEPHGA